LKPLTLDLHSSVVAIYLINIQLERLTARLKLLFIKHVIIIIIIIITTGIITNALMILL